MHLYLKLCLNTIQKWLELCQYSWGHIIDSYKKYIGYLWQCYANNTNIEVTWCVINNDLRECTGTQLWQLHTLAPYWWIGLWGKCEVYIYMLTLCKCCVGGSYLDTIIRVNVRTWITDGKVLQLFLPCLDLLNVHYLFLLLFSLLGSCLHEWVTRFCIKLQKV